MDAEVAAEAWVDIDGYLERAVEALRAAKAGGLAEVSELQKLLAKMLSTALALKKELPSLSEDHSRLYEEAGTATADLAMYRKVITLDDLIALHNKILDRHEEGGGEHEGGFSTCGHPICKSAAAAGFDPRERWTND